MWTFPKPHQETAAGLCGEQQGLFLTDGPLCSALLCSPPGSERDGLSPPQRSDADEQEARSAARPSCTPCRGADIRMCDDGAVSHLDPASLRATLGTAHRPLSGQGSNVVRGAPQLCPHRLHTGGPGPWDTLTRDSQPSLMVTGSPHQLPCVRPSCRLPPTYKALPLLRSGARRSPRYRLFCLSPQPRWHPSRLGEPEGTPPAPCGLALIPPHPPLHRPHWRTSHATRGAEGRLPSPSMPTRHALPTQEPLCHQLLTPPFPTPAGRVLRAACSVTHLEIPSAPPRAGCPHLQPSAPS